MAPYVALAVASVVAVVYFLAYVLVNQTHPAEGEGLFSRILSGALYGELREVFVYVVVNLLSTTAILFAIFRVPIIRPLAWAPVALVGRISYGGYLYHAFVVWGLGVMFTGHEICDLALTDRIFWFLIAWPITVSLAYCSYRYFEKPIIDWARHRDIGRAPSPQVAQQA